ncbi:MAG: tetratricopeptide repeat protein, partial [Acidobacteriota bacterium]
MKPLLAVLPAALLTAVVLACGSEQAQKPGSASGEDDALPRVDLSTLPASIRDVAQQARARAEASPDDPDAVGALGMQYLAHGFPLAAATCFHRASRLDPRSMRWLYYLGFANQGGGRITRAVKALERAVALQPGYSPALVRLGDLLIETDPDRSEGLYRHAIAANPDSATAYFGLGRVARLAGRTQEALVDFRRAVAIYPDYADAHYAIAMILSAQGKREEAAEELSKHAAGGPPPITDDPLQEEIARLGESASSLRHEAEHLSRSGEMNAAIQLLEKAIARDVSGSTSHIHLGLVLARGGKFREAVEQFELALKADPDSVEARSSLGLALTELGRIQEAEKTYREVLAQHPDHAPTLIYLGRLLAQMGRIDEGLDDLRRGVASQPANGLFQYTLGEALAASGHEREALPHLRKAVAEMPHHAMARHALGVVLARGGDLEGAREQFEAAVREAPTLAAAYLGLAGIALQHSDAASAVRYAEKACELKGYSGKF